MNEIVKLALDVYHGTVPTEFADKNPEAKLREALIAANGGSDKIDMKSMRDNKGKLFAIVEETIQTVVEEGLKGDEFFMNFVDFRNLAVGDLNEFTIEADSSFIVSEIANGIATPRRQRIGEKTTVNVPTTIKAVRVYEEMSRVLSGRISWTDFVDKVSVAVMQKRYNDIFTVWNGMSASSAGLNSTYVPTAGSYSENNLVTLIDHVEAATGKTARIVGTRNALRKLNTAVVADAAKDDMYNSGFYGKFNGTDMIRVRNRHKVGTTTFIMPDDKVFVVASDDQPIKFVDEGTALILDKDPTANADLSQEYTYVEKTGCGLVVNGKIGVYSMT